MGKVFKKLIFTFAVLFACFGMINIAASAEVDFSDRHLEVYSKDVRDGDNMYALLHSDTYNNVIIPKMEVFKEYVVNPDVGPHDAKWFSFTPTTTDNYCFVGLDMANGAVDVDSQANLYEVKTGYLRCLISCDDVNSKSHQFGFTALLEEGHEYLLLAGFTEGVTTPYVVTVGEGKNVSQYQAILKDGVETYHENMMTIGDAIKAVKFIYTDETEKAYNYAPYIQDVCGNGVTIKCTKYGQSYVFSASYQEVGRWKEVRILTLNEKPVTDYYSQAKAVSSEKCEKVPAKTLCSFEPQEAGLYAIRTVDQFDVTNLYYDESGKSLAASTDVDGKDRSEFKSNQYFELKANTKYYFYADANKEQSFYIEKLPDGELEPLPPGTIVKDDDGDNDEPGAGGNSGSGNNNPSSGGNSGTGNNASGNGSGNSGNGNIVADQTTVIPVTSLNITGLSHKIAAGKKVALKAEIYPENATDQTLTWVSSNPKVATADSQGLVRVKKKTGGKSVIIKAISPSSGVVATYKIVSMKGVVKKITITGAKAVAAGKSLKLKAKVTATKKANKQVRWTSSDPSLATVNAKGLVVTNKAAKGKKVKITAMATDGSGKKKTVIIKIK